MVLIVLTCVETCNVSVISIRRVLVGQDNTQAIIDPFKKNIFDMGWIQQCSGSVSNQFLTVDGKLTHHNTRGRSPKDIPSSPR